ncbi:MAG: Electron transport complex subunit RsxG [Phycisphaerae bacterium]|nr:Electron transport complex subunit RsxG [Phycisphaerae bacterium]
MKSFLQQTWLVIVLAVGFGAALAGVEHALAPRIARNAVDKLHGAINEVVPGGVASARAQGVDLEIYRVTDAAGRTVGWAYPSSALGYADNVVVLVGLDAGGQQIVGVQILKSNETPGLGDRVKGEQFRDRFKGKRTDAPIPLLRGSESDPNGVDVLTGATYSSRAVVNACNVKREKVSAIIAAELAKDTAATPGQGTP